MSAKISSKSNDRIKYVKKLGNRAFRDKEKRFLVEGVRLVEESLQEGRILEVFFSDKLLQNQRGTELFNRLTDTSIPIRECSEAVLEEVANTVNNQGVAGIVGFLEQPPIEKIDPKVLIIADQVQDPGNLGVLFRTAAAAGVGGIILTPGTVDPYNAKAVRASMGALFKLPYWHLDSEGCVSLCQSLGMSLVIADPHDSEEYFEVDLSGDLALVIGNEARGVNNYLVKNATKRVMIPMSNGVESLNASVSAGILLFEMYRQRLQR